MNSEDETQTEQLRSRLLSIIYDRFYLETKVVPLFPGNYTIIPNERCGNWYASNNKNITCYFKSTDGHKNQWNFNYRRLNLHLLTELLTNKGIIIVDSSKYRQIPDSLSKTIPIWCCVLSLTINESLFINKDNEIDLKKFNDLAIFLLDLPIQLESLKNEYDSILNKMLNFYETSKKYHSDLNIELKKIGFDVKENEQIIKLKPSWIYPGLELINISTETETFNDLPVILYNIVLCSVSDYKHISRHHKMLKYQPNKQHNKFDLKFNYYQGAGDDHELWALKLDPNRFNDNIKEIEKMLINNKKESLDSFYEFINNLCLENEGKQKNEVQTIKLISNIHLATNDMLEHLNLSDFDKIICFGYTKNINFPKGSLTFPNMSDDKKGIRIFSTKLKEIDDVILSKLKTNQNKKFLISSEKYELNIGTVLVLLSKYNDDEEFKKKDCNKLKLRQLYISICNSTDINIKTSRLLLNNINNYILS